MMIQLVNVYIINHGGDVRIYRHIYMYILLQVPISVGVSALSDF